MPVIDARTFNELKQMSGGDFINELIDAFLEDGPRMLDNLRIALDARDVESFRRNALPEDQCHYLRPRSWVPRQRNWKPWPVTKIWRLGTGWKN